MHTQGSNSPCNRIHSHEQQQDHTRLGYPTSECKPQYSQKSPHRSEWSGGRDRPLSQQYGAQLTTSQAWAPFKLFLGRVQRCWPCAMAQRASASHTMFKISGDWPHCMVAAAGRVYRHVDALPVGSAVPCCMTSVAPNDECPYCSCLAPASVQPMLLQVITHKLNCYPNKCHINRRQTKATPTQALSNATR